MKYYKPFKLVRDRKLLHKYFGIYDRNKHFTDTMIFMSGKILPTKNVGQINYSQDPSTYDLVFYVDTFMESILQLDYIPVNISAPIVNNKALQVLKNLCSDSFQAFPAVIEGSSKVKNPFVIKNEYWLINITETIDSINMEKSELTLDTDNEIEDIRHLVFKEGVMQDGNIHIARERLYHPHIMVSPQLKEAFEKHKIKGCEFLTDEEYNRLSF